MNTKIIQNIKSIILALAIILGAGYASAAWTNPPSGTVPPANNVEAPINVGSTLQTKTGNLILSGLSTLDHLITGDLTVTNSVGSVTGISTGSTLVADGDNTGKVKWGLPPTILGPLTYSSSDLGNNSTNYVVSDFTLTQASDVVITSSANLCGGPILNVYMYVDGVQKDKKAFRGESNGADCGSVSLSTRMSLTAGAHSVKTQGGLFTSYPGYGDATRPVDTLVYVLNGSGFAAGGSGGSSGGVSSITAGSGISVSGSTGAVTVSATGTPSAVGAVCGSAIFKNTTDQFGQYTLTGSWGCAVDPTGQNFQGANDTNTTSYLRGGTCSGGARKVTLEDTKSFICVNQ